jgi:methylmalonyl-CoA/ethylmalonyl-CoA epimerase
MIRLDHIGIAVEALPELEALFALLGLSVAAREAVPEQGVTTHFIASANPPRAADTKIELLEVTDPKGTVAKFIEKRGAGIHHLSFQVGSGELDALCGELRKKGVKLTYDVPRSGAHGMRINFIHPSSAGGVLIEIMEPS